MLVSVCWCEYLNLCKKSLCTQSSSQLTSCQLCVAPCPLSARGSVSCCSLLHIHTHTRTPSSPHTRFHSDACIVPHAPTPPFCALSCCCHGRGAADGGEWEEVQRGVGDGAGLRLGGGQRLHLLTESLTGHGTPQWPLAMLTGRPGGRSTMNSSPAWAAAAAIAYTPTF